MKPVHATACFLVLLFVAGIVLASLVWPHITLPFSNPLEVVGPLTVARFNPANNLLRYVVYVTAPAMLLLGFHAAHPAIRGLLGGPGAARTGPKPRAYTVLLHFRPWMHGLSVLLLALYAWWGFVRILDWPWTPAPVDFFHAGESLTPAFNYLRDKGVWTGSYFVHGAFYDVFSTVWLWRFFGLESVGAYYVSLHFGGSLTGAGIAFFVYALSTTATRHTRGLQAVALAQLLLLVWLATEWEFHYLDRRDVPVLLGTGILLLAFGYRSRLLACCASMFSALCYFYTIDRGAYFTATLIVMWLFFSICSRESRMQKALLGASLGAGFVAGWATFYLLAGQQEFAAFIESTALIYRTKDLFDAYVYPAPGWQIYDVHVRSMALNAFQCFVFVVWLLRDYRAGRNLGQGMAHLSLVCLAVFYYRSGLGRSDESHVLYASSFAYLGAAFALYLCLDRLREWRVAALAPALLLAVNGAFLYSHRPHTPLLQLGERLSRISQYAQLPDESFLAPDERIGIRRLRQIFEAEPCIYSLTSEAALPYLLAKPSCGRNYVAWFASPRPRRDEMMRDLERYSPNYVLFHSTFWSNAIDGIGNGQRFPDVQSFVLARYRPFETVQGRWQVYERIAN